MACEWTTKVEAFYDGELPADEAAHVEAHLRECGDCAAIASELRGLTRLIAAAPMAAITASAERKMRQAWWAARERVSRDRGVLHLAEWLTGAAAAVLVGTLMLTSNHQPLAASAQTPATWQTAAVMPPTATDGEAAPHVVVLAEWMANDLSSDAGH